jgi:beta-glucanase (GH16 family)
MGGSFLIAAIISAAFLTNVRIEGLTSNTYKFAQTPSWSQNYRSMPDGPLSGSLWNYDEGNNNGWGNGELQSYTSDSSNVRVQKGLLTINALKSGSGYTSARITTKGKIDFTYGKIDVVAKLPKGQGVWPAIWFLPSDNKYSNTQTTGDDQSRSWLANGEIDLAEGTADGRNTISGSAHALAHFSGNAPRSGMVEVDPAKFHTYSMQWTPKSIDLLVDQKSYLHVDDNGQGFREWPYDQRFHLLMNIAVGGDMSSGGVGANSLPAEMQVASISYYPLAQ